MTPTDCLHQLATALQTLEPDAPLTPWAQQAQQHWPTLQTALPPKYLDVLQGLLDRLESAALFGGESCSFSQTDLHQLLQQWTAQATAYLAKTKH